MENRTCGSILCKIEISNKTGYLAEPFSKQSVEGPMWLPSNVIVKREEERDALKTEFVIKREAEI